MSKTRVISSKQKVMIGPDKSQMLNKIRMKFSYREDNKDRTDGTDIGINSLIEWANSQPEKVDEEGKIIPSEITFWKVHNSKRPDEGLLPPELYLFVQYMINGAIPKIPESEIRGYTFHVLNAPKQKSNDEISFDQCKMYVSDRFIFTYGSNELLQYQVIDIDRIKEYAGLGKKTPVIEVIEDPVRPGDVIHMDIQGAIATLPTVNNKTSYPRPDKKGFQKGVSVSKNPLRRTIIILDIIATTEKVQTVLRDKVSTFREILDTKPNSQKAQMIRNFQRSADSAASADVATGDAEIEEAAEDSKLPVDVTEDEVPTLVPDQNPTNRVEVNGVTVEDVNEESDEDLSGF